MSRDEFHDDSVLTVRRVRRRFERIGPVLDLTVNGRVIGTTHEHPFFVRGRGWTKAQELRVGDDVRRMGPGWATVEAVSDTGRLETVYNLEIEDDHTYFVGCDEWGFAVWAHNNGCDEFLDEMVKKKRIDATEADLLRVDPEFRAIFDAVDDPLAALQKYGEGQLARLHGIPTESSSFKKWFDEVDLNELDRVYRIPEARDYIKGKLRHGGGDHEWLLVSRGNRSRSWGLGYDEITTLTTPTKSTWFLGAKGARHAHDRTSVSKLAHDELGRLMDDSQSYAEYLTKLRTWATTNLPNGVNDLPAAMR